MENRTMARAFQSGQFEGNELRPVTLRYDYSSLPKNR